VEDLEVLVARWHGAELVRSRQGHFGYKALRDTMARVEEFAA